MLFTSGATESNNLALLGLRQAGLEQGTRHVITTAIEHKAILEPCAALEDAGFAVTWLPVSAGGLVSPETLREALRPDTWLVSVMQANNETGVRQPLAEICEALQAFSGLNPRLVGEQSLVMEHVLNLSFPRLDSEALMLALKDWVAISNGSACTSSSYTPSHVLKAMGLSDDDANGCVRLSWCHLTPAVDWAAMAERIRGLI